MAISEARLAANRANARKSTGPRSAAGRRAVRLNALRHGLAGETAVLPEEDAAAFGELLDDMERRFAAVGGAERVLVRRMAESMWRLRRGAALEATTLAALFEKEEAGELSVDDVLDAPRLLLRVSRYEGQIERAYERALERLRMLQRARLMDAKAVARPAPAAGEGRPEAPKQPKPGNFSRSSAADGFVSSFPPPPPSGPLGARLRASCAPAALLVGDLGPPWRFSPPVMGATLAAAPEELPRAA